MLNRKWKLLVLLLVVPVILFGCGIDKGKDLEMGEITYEIIEIPSAEFEKLYQGEFAKWYDKNHRIEGLHSFTDVKDRYLLLSAGEKPTGGYYLENLVILGREGEIEVKAKLHVPGKDEKVTMAFSYPHLLVRIAEDGRQLVFGGIEGNVEQKESEIRKDTGRFMGQIDGNSIEVKVSGVPEDMSLRAFQLGDNIKEDFDKYGLEPGDEIIFTYEVPRGREGERPVIIEINKLN
ncbi:MAG: protease complex subunit PrcB family protein [Firmicutes bacterium]|nr:protease complex subunit PrcB family protein [Bacillota bacterium]